MKSPLLKNLAVALALALTSVAARAETIEMKVFGMVCGFCAQSIEATLRKYPATEEVVVSLEDKLVVGGNARRRGHSGHRSSKGDQGRRVRPEERRAHEAHDRRSPQALWPPTTVDAHVRNVGVAFGTLLASGATLLCCVLPAVLVAFGAGATMAVS